MRMTPERSVSVTFKVAIVGGAQNHVTLYDESLENKPASNRRARYGKSAKTKRRARRARRISLNQNARQVRSPETE